MAKYRFGRTTRHWPRPSGQLVFSRAFLHLILVAGSLATGLVLVELLLRVVDYRFSPIVFVRPDNADDHRAFHMGGRDLRIRARPLTVPDPDLLWKTDPSASAELTSEGFRGRPLEAPQPDGGRLVVAFGDSNTLGPLATADHWPGFLEDLLRANGAPSSLQVLNAGVYGYTSFQGLRLFRKLIPYRPSIAYFSFGANDAQPVINADAQYSQRMDRLRGFWDLRLGPPLLNSLWRLRDSVHARPATCRVPLADYRANLVAFVEEAAAAGVLPILLTRPLHGASADPSTLLHHAPAYNAAVREVAAAMGTPIFDAEALFRDQPDRFADAIHNDRIGYLRLAEALLSQLAALGVVETDDRRAYASALDLATADERRMELGPGFWLREVWPSGASGRWTQREATIRLRRAATVANLVVDLSCYRPVGSTRGRIEVDGRTLATLPEGNGRYSMTLPVEAGRDGPLEVRFVVESAYRPKELAPTARDDRLLGVFLHGVRLVQ